MTRSVILVTLTFFLLATFGLACGSGDGQPAADSQKPAPETAPARELSKQEQIIAEGTRIANKAAALLGGEVTRAMSLGVSTAIEYCNVQAYPLLDSLSKADNVYIKRTSLRLRNPNNLPSESEYNMLTLFEGALENGQPDYRIVRPRVADEGDHWAFYAPIFIKNPVCLNCHGKVGSEIAQKDYDLIKELYPQDQATDFAMGDLRGMWSIQFQK